MKTTPPKSTDSPAQQPPNNDPRREKPTAPGVIPPPPASDPYLPILPGLTVGRLAILASILATDQRTGDALVAVNKAISIWNEAARAFKVQETWVRDRKHFEAGWISFREMAEQGRVPSSTAKGIPIGSLAGIRNAVKRFYEALEEGTAEALSQCSDHESRDTTTRLLKAVIDSSMAESGCPFGILAPLTDFQKALAKKQTFQVGAETINAVLGLSLPERLKTNPEL